MIWLVVLVVILSVIFAWNALQANDAGSKENNNTPMPSGAPGQTETSDEADVAINIVQTEEGA